MGSAHRAIAFLGAVVLLTIASGAASADCASRPLNAGSIHLDAQGGKPLGMELFDDQGTTYATAINTAVFSHAVISEDVAERFHLPVKDSYAMRVSVNDADFERGRYAGGTFTLRFAKRSTVSFDRPFVIHAKTPDVVHLGNDFLVSNHVILDYPAQRLFFNNLPGGASRDGEAGRSSFAFRTDLGMPLTISVLDAAGGRWKATVSTQAVGSCAVSEEVATVNGLIPTEGPYGRFARGILALTLPDGRIYRFKDPLIVPAVRSNPITLGNDFLVQSHAVIDYRERRISPGPSPGRRSPDMVASPRAPRPRHPVKTAP